MSEGGSAPLGTTGANGLLPVPAVLPGTVVPMVVLVAGVTVPIVFSPA